MIDAGVPLSTSPIGGSIGQTTKVFPPTAVATLSGSGTANWDIKDHLGVSLRGVGGYNLGEYPYYKNEDAETVVAGLLARGIKVLRLVGFNRWCSNPSKGVGDSRVNSCPYKKSPRNRARLRAYAKACSKLGMWFIIVGEGDVLQGGTGSETIYAASMALAAQYPDAIPGGALTWAAAGGFNIYTSPSLLAEFVEQWKDIVREFKYYPYLLAWEPMSEPLPAAGTWDNPSAYGTPGQRIYAGWDGSGEYGVEWTTGDTSVHETAESVFRRIIYEIDKLDGVHPYTVGGTRGYDLSPQLTDLLTALQNPGGLGGDLVAANKIIGTIDILSSGVTAHTVANKVITLLGTKVPCLINQLGTRHSAEDPTDEALMAAISAMRAAGIICILWEHISNTSNGYGELYYPGTGDVNQEGVDINSYGVVDSGFRTNTVNTQFNYTLAALQTARDAAAAAENLLDWYTDAFDQTLNGGNGAFPRLFQDEAATIPCTAIGDPVGAWLPKSDPQATGFKWCASTTARPTLGWMIDDGAGNSLLPHKRPALIFDGTNTLMRLKTAGASPVETRYWGGASLTGAEVVFAMVGVRPNNLAQNQTFVSQGSTERFPRLYATIGKLPSIGFQGDDASLKIASGTTTVTPNNPMVVTGTKTGSAGSEIITTYVNGRQEGQITGQTVGSVASASTRVRLGGLSTASDFVGRLNSVSLGRTALPSTNHRYDMGRHAAWLMGTGYPA